MRSLRWIGNKAGNTNQKINKTHMIRKEKESMRKTSCKSDVKPMNKIQEYIDSISVTNLDIKEDE